MPCRCFPAEGGMFSRTSDDDGSSSDDARHAFLPMSLLPVQSVGIAAAGRRRPGPGAPVSAFSQGSPSSVTSSGSRGQLSHAPNSLFQRDNRSKWSGTMLLVRASRLLLLHHYHHHHHHPLPLSVSLSLSLSLSVSVSLLSVLSLLVPHLTTHTPPRVVRPGPPLPPSFLC